MSNLYNNPMDVRTWYYFPIVMPLNSEGHGPASEGEIAKLTWEVWTQDLTSIDSFDNFPDAINRAMELNKELGFNRTFDELWIQLNKKEES